MLQVRVTSHYDFQDVAGVVALSGVYSTTEPLVETSCDLHVQKIGKHYKAFT